MSAKNKSSSMTSLPGRTTNMPMATRRSSNADQATGGTPQGASPNELITRISMQEQVLVAKLDTVVGDLRAEFSNTIKLLETSFDKLKTETAGLKDELKLVQTGRKQPHQNDRTGNQTSRSTGTFNC